MNETDKVVDELVKDLKQKISKEIVEGQVFDNGLIAISPDTLAKDFISKDVLDEKLTEWIEDHIITRPAGKLIRILPHEWDDFKKELLNNEVKDGR